MRAFMVSAKYSNFTSWCINLMAMYCFLAILGGLPANLQLITCDRKISPTFTKPILRLGSLIRINLKREQFGTAVASQDKYSYVILNGEASPTMLCKYSRFHIQCRFA